MAAHATKLKVRAGGSEVVAALHDRLSLDDLFDAEAAWCADRVRVLRALSCAGVDAGSEGWPESVHWSWAWKGANCSTDRLEAVGDARVFGVEVAGEWQALM